MHKPRPYVILLAAFFSVLLIKGPDIRAQEVSAGLFNSFKGFGLSTRIMSEDAESRSFSLYADIYGLPLAEVSGAPGVKFNYSHDSVLRSYRAGSAAASLYAGPGMTIGYARDFRKGDFGLVAALSGELGCRFRFDRRIVMDICMQTEAGVWIAKDKYLQNITLSLYKNGFIMTILPQLRLEYEF